jgi:hypothetical protein
VETAIMRQNQVLSSFIANVQNELKSKPSSPVEIVDLSTPEARESAEIQVSKIVVSDDEDEDDDDDDSNESETEDDTEDEGDGKAEGENNAEGEGVGQGEGETENYAENDAEGKAENKCKDITNVKIVFDNDIKEVNLDNLYNSEIINIVNSIDNDVMHHIKIVDIQDLSMLMNIQSQGQPQNHSQSTIYEISDDSSDESEEENDNEEQDEEVKVVKIKEEPITPTKPVSQPPLKHDQMRVDDLRKLVLDKKLATKEDVKKLKKPELLTLLVNE